MATIHVPVLFDISGTATVLGETYPSGSDPIESHLEFTVAATSDYALSAGTMRKAFQVGGQQDDASGAIFYSGYVAGALKNSTGGATGSIAAARLNGSPAAENGENVYLAAQSSVAVGVDSNSAANPSAGSGATFRITTTGGGVSKVEVMDPGSGYLAGNVITINKDDVVGLNANIEITLTAAEISSVAAGNKSIHIDNFCSLVASTLLQADLVHANHASKSVPFGGANYTSHTLSAQNLGTNNAPEAMAKVCCNHLIGHPLSQALFTDESSLNEDLSANDVTVQNWDGNLQHILKSGDDACALEHQLSAIFGGSQGVTELANGGTAVTIASADSNPALLSIFEQIMVSGQERSSDICGAVISGTNTSTADFPIKAGDTLVFYLRPTIDLALNTTSGNVLRNPLSGTKFATTADDGTNALGMLKITGADDGAGGTHAALTLPAAPPAGTGVSHTNAGQSLSSGKGSGAEFTITITNNAVSAVAVTSPGSGYSAGDTITIPKADFGGPENGDDLVITLVSDNLEDVLPATGNNLTISDIFEGAGQSSYKAGTYGWMGHEDNDTLSVQVTNLTEKKTFDCHIWKISVALAA